MITLQKVLEVSTKTGDGIPIAHPAREFLSSLINEPNTVISEPSKQLVHRNLVL